MIMATTIACVRGKIHFVLMLDWYASTVLLVTKILLVMLGETYWIFRF